MAFVFVGQTHTNSLILMLCCVVVAVLWSPLLWSKPRPHLLARTTTVLIVGANLLLILWTWFQLPEAREFQRQFNDQRQQGGDTAAGAGSE